MDCPALRTGNLTKGYGRLLALDDLDLTVPAGEVFGFLGPNGAGKSTTIRILLGLVRPSAGRAWVFDTDAADVAAAGANVGEPAWRMPISESHREALRSDIADLRQCATGRRQPDACQAAAFLREFVDGTPWVHLDIAGVEARERADDRAAAGATGFGVRLLDRLVAARFEGQHRA